ncbi:Phosphatidylinositol N-acetylglucosaminyltransferase GPI3 subunit, partial [Tilletia horrida]
GQSITSVVPARDFSVMRSLHKMCSMLLLDPARFTKHHCEAKVTIIPNQIRAHHFDLNNAEYHNGGDDMPSAGLNTIPVPLSDSEGNVTGSPGVGAEADSSLSPPSGGWPELAMEVDDIDALSSAPTSRSSATRALPELAAEKRQGIRAGFTDQSLLGFANAASILTNQLLNFLLLDIEHVISPKRVDLKQLREGYLLNDSVDLVGAIRPSDARAQLNSGYLFLNTSLTEAFGINIIAAASAGLFVVSTHVGGVLELLPAEFIKLAEPDEDARFYSWSDVVSPSKRIYL